MSITDLEFYLTKPIVGGNFITNPSIEIDTTGYTSVQSSLSRSSSKQRRGRYSMLVAPVTNQIAGFYWVTGTLLTSQSYVFSADVWDVVGQSYSIWFADSGGTAVGTPITWTGSGRWGRHWVALTPPSAATYRLYVTRAAIASTSAYYVDGLQLEYSTSRPGTYIDGDVVGFGNIGVTREYYWTGVPHASTSGRLGTSGHGGQEIRLKDYVNIVSVQGFGLPPMRHFSLPKSTGGDYYLGSAFNTRILALKCTISGNTVSEIMDKHKALVDAVDPMTIPVQTPRLLRIRGLTAVGGSDDMETLDAYVLYEDGLDGSHITPGISEIVLRFRMFSSTFIQDGTTVFNLTTNNTIQTITDNYVMRDLEDGASAMGTGCQAGNPIALVESPTQPGIIAGGTFTTAGGVANTAYIASWSGTAWSALATGANGLIRTLQYSLDGGTLYAGGEFTLMSGVANTVKIARWVGGAWQALGTGLSGGTGVATPRCMSIGPDGMLYVGGDFGSAGGVGGTAYIARWSGSAWQSLGTVDGPVYCMAWGADGFLYFGGNFSTVGGISVAKFGKWSSATGFLGPIGGGFGNIPTVMMFGPDGWLYAGGAFTAAGGVANTAYIVKYNGIAFQSLNAGLNDMVVSMTFSNGQLIIGGDFTTAGGQTLPDKVAIFTGAAWVPLEANFAGTGTVTALLAAKWGTLYAGHNGSGSGVFGNYPTVLTVAGSAAVPFRIQILGPGRIYSIRNINTGKAIYFNLALVESEILTIKTGSNPSVVSSLRGNLLNTVMPGSSLDMVLMPGPNDFGVFIPDMTGNTTVHLLYEAAYANIGNAR